jgi:hypothetical protein
MASESKKPLSLSLAALAAFAQNGQWTIGHTNVMDIVHEIESSSPRVTMVVGIALLDDCLTSALSACSRLRDKSFLDRCWGERGSIRDFSQKVDLGACFGLYGKITHADLVKMRDIRNQAAHHSRRRDFKSADIKGLCRDLALPDLSGYRHNHIPPKDPRERFIYTVSLVTDFLIAYAYSTELGATLKSRLP